MGGIRQCWQQRWRLACRRRRFLAHRGRGGLSQLASRSAVTSVGRSRRRPPMSEVSGKSGDGPEKLPVLPDMRLEQFFLATLRSHIFLEDQVAADQHGTHYTAWERVTRIAWCVSITDTGGPSFINSSGSKLSRPYGRVCSGAWAVWRCTIPDSYLPRSVPSARHRSHLAVLLSHSFRNYSRDWDSAVSLFRA